MPGPTPVLVAVVVLAGMVRGNLTLIQATAVTDRWGTTHYGRLSGVLAAPVAIAAPVAFVRVASTARPFAVFPGRGLAAPPPPAIGPPLSA